jgi:hypothetical protein
VTGEVFEPVGDRWEGALWDPERSRREISSERDNGSSDCVSLLGYNRLRIDRHSSKDCERASRVLSFLLATAPTSWQKFHTF